MLNNTVDIKFYNGTTQTICVEKINTFHIEGRLADDTTDRVILEDVQSINVVNGDGHQEFTNEFLMVRKDRKLQSLIGTITDKFDSIIRDCPEDYGTLTEELVDMLNKVKQ